MFVAVIGGGIGGWGLLSKSSVEGYYEKLVALGNEGTSALKPVQDAAAASVVAPKVRDVFKRINDLIEEMKDKKGREEEVREAQQRYGPRIEAAYSTLGQEVARVFSIPVRRARWASMTSSSGLPGAVLDAADGTAADAPADRAAHAGADADAVSADRTSAGVRTRSAARLRPQAGLGRGRGCPAGRRWGRSGGLVRRSESA